MNLVNPSIESEYRRFKKRFNGQLWGLIEIGSYARGEAVSGSDRDLRLVIRTGKPFTLLKGFRWTEGSSAQIDEIEWFDLNQIEGASFGLTNVGYVEHLIQFDRYPLEDHTCLYQGKIIVDESSALSSFCARYARKLFPNIVPDYINQTDWRVTQKLSTIIDSSTVVEQLDHRKYAVSLIHACCRVIRDIVNIVSYRDQGQYVSSLSVLDSYYREQWAWFHSSFQTLFSYKINETMRHAVFDDIKRRDLSRLAELNQLREMTVELWRQFKSKE